MQSPLAKLETLRRRLKAQAWARTGRPAYGRGYNTARWLAIEEGIATASEGKYGWDGAGLDERVVEYPWLFDRMGSQKKTGARVLDAGSVLNHARMLRLWRGAKLPPLSIVTLKYEGHAFPSDEARYEFADLRALPYRDEWFSTVLCLSTIEHVGLDNTIYGASAESNIDPGREAIRAVQELQRVTMHGGTLLLSVPYGERSNRGWFRVFDADDLARLTSVQGWTNPRPRYFRAMVDGWRETSAREAASAGYNEPAGRSGQQTAPKWVAAAEAVALVELTRS